MKNIKVPIVIFAILISLLMPYQTMGAKDNVIINIGKSNIEDVDFSKSNWSFKLWRVSNSIEDIDVDRINKDLDPLSERELDRIYTDFLISPKSDRNGLISMKLEVGTYYLRQYDSNSDIKFYPFVVIVHGQGDIETAPKWHENKTGETLVIKTSSDGLRLKGAEFELYFLDKSDWKRVPLARDYSYDINGSKDRVLVTNSSGEFRLSNLPKGRYMLKEIKAPDGYFIKNESHYFNVGDDLVILEIVNQREPRGGHRFFKMSEDERPLANTRFVVTTKEGDYYHRVKVDGVDYTVVSDENGEFAVENLPYGDYYLWETVPTLGHSSLSKGIAFTIDGSSQDNVIAIKNKRIPTVPPTEPPMAPPTVPPTVPPTEPPIEPPTVTPPDVPLIKVPKTGDVSILFMIGSGILLIFVGYVLIRED